MALAMIANAKGYLLRTPLSVLIPQEKRTVLRLFGADVIELQDTLCPAPGAPEGAIALAMKTAELPDFEMLNQYENEANPDGHYKTTGPEVWKQTGGRITHFVAGQGNMALAGAFEMIPDEKGNLVVVVFPDNAFKYASSFAKHLPQVRSENAQMSLEERLMKGMVKQAHNEHMTIEPDDALNVMEKNKPYIMDVRAFDSYRKPHVRGAQSVPIDDIEDYVPLLPEDRDASIITVCDRGNLSLFGVLYLTSLGYKNALSLNGGTLGWIDRGYPTESG